MNINKKKSENNNLFRWLKWAIIASIIATIGDFIFMFLFVIDTKTMDLNMVKVLLWVAGLLGVMAIPFYAIGYRAVSALLFASKSIASKLFLSLAVVVSLCGGAIHGITAINMYRQIKESNLNPDPMISMMSWGSFFLGLWVVAVVGIITASCVYFWIVINKKTKLKQSMAYLNPVFITIVISLVSLLFGAAGKYIAPTAPNMAHIVFFIILLAAIKNGRK